MLLMLLNDSFRISRLRTWKNATIGIANLTTTAKHWTLTFWLTVEWTETATWCGLQCGLHIAQYAELPNGRTLLNSNIHLIESFHWINWIEPYETVNLRFSGMHFWASRNGNTSSSGLRFEVWSLRFLQKIIINFKSNCQTQIRFFFSNSPLTADYTWIVNCSF